MIKVTMEDNGTTMNGIKVPDYDDSQYNYRLIDRESEVECIQQWICEGSKDKDLMQVDLDYLRGLDDKYIFASYETNSYIACSDNETEFYNHCLAICKIFNIENAEEILMEKGDLVEVKTIKAIASINDIVTNGDLTPTQKIAEATEIVEDLIPDDDDPFAPLYKTEVSVNLYNALKLGEKWLASRVEFELRKNGEDITVEAMDYDAKEIEEDGDILYEVQVTEYSSNEGHLTAIFICDKCGTSWTELGNEKSTSCCSTCNDKKEHPAICAVPTSLLK